MKLGIRLRVLIHTGRHLVRIDTPVQLSGMISPHWTMVDPHNTLPIVDEGVGARIVGTFNGVFALKNLGSHGHNEVGLHGSGILGELEGVLVDYL